MFNIGLAEDGYKCQLVGRYRQHVARWSKLMNYVMIIDDYWWLYVVSWTWPAVTSPALGICWCRGTWLGVSTPGSWTLTTRQLWSPDTGSLTGEERVSLLWQSGVNTRMVCWWRGMGQVRQQNKMNEFKNVCCQVTSDCLVWLMDTSWWR